MLLRAKYWVGGVVGMNESQGLIQDCYFMGGSISASGGDVGFISGGNDNSTNTRCCYISGGISGPLASRAALVGCNSSLIRTCYWNTAAALPPTGSSCLGTMLNCFGCTATQMMQQVTFTNWDFESVWLLTRASCQVYEVLEVN